MVVNDRWSLNAGGLIIQVVSQYRLYLNTGGFLIGSTSG